MDGTDWLAAWRAEEAEDDRFRSWILDHLAEQCDGNEKAFAAGAIVILAAWMVGYRG